MRYHAPVKYTPDYHTIVALQRVLAADALQPGLSANDRATLVKAWDQLMDRKWVLRNKPKVKPVEARDLVPKDAPPTFLLPEH